MKKTTLFARLLAGIMTVFFLMGGGVSCSDGSDKDNTPETKYYTVTFDSNGGSEVKPQTVEAGKVATKPDDPTNGDYIFDAWYVEGGNSFDFASAITADIKLVANWKDPGKEYCTVTFKESSDDKGTTQSVEKGTAATKPTDPTKEGYTFLGWFVGEDAFDFSTQISNDITLTAKWETIASSGDGEKPGDVEGEGEGDKKPDESSEPVISGPVASGVRNLKASNEELETAYITWTAADNAKWYNVYVKSTGAGEWTQLDGPLVRQYADYFRADALGLTEGTYDMKVVPVSGEDTEASDYASEATGITVKAHERAGYGFVNGTSSGAYNEDGTLKKDAVVLYVTNDNYDKITLQTGKGLMTGIDSILGEGYQSKKGDTKPLCIRIVGSIGTGSKLGFKAGGDLELKGLDQGVTIEGVGNDATANGWGLHITTSSNVEVRNLAFMEMQGTTKDGVSIESKCHHIWVHNCDFFYGHNWGGDQKKGDGSLDTKGSTNITHSYNHFWDSGKCNLQGMESASDSGVYQITYHHNWYDHSDSRHPRIRRATVHIYNNYFDGNAKYGVGVTNGASAFAENNYFRSTAKIKPMLSSMQGTDIAHGKDGQTFSGENGGMIKAFGNKFDGSYELLTQNDTDANNLDCYLASTRTEQVPSSYTTKQGGTTYNNFDTAADMYKYSVDTAEQAKEKVERYAGRLDGGDLSYKFDNATQDKNYEIIPELSQLIQNYSKTLTLVKIGGGTASTTPGGNTGTGDEGDGDNTGDNQGGNESGATTGNMTASFTANKAVAANDVLVIVKDGDSQIASVKSKIAFSLKTSGAGGVQASSTGAFEISLKAGYTYTITMNLGSSGSSKRTVTINGETKDTGTSSAFTDCTWTVNAAEDKTLTSTENGNIRFLTITVTAVKN